ncbi:MAG: nitroreductase family deazaflavin-dependent oxidoreductase [Chloroflexota bacterium]|nr:MAG: nitroreductase family deazaflavin-dependent oxidoreductase [Chloroflexota bacterium]
MQRFDVEHPMPDTAADPWEEALIADMRAHGGAVTSGPMAGHPLLLMTSIGARSGQPRRAILTYSRDAGEYIVAGTAGGSPTDPMWVNNVRRTPHVTLEVGTQTIQALATFVEGAERDRLWDAHVRALPWFAEYPEQSGRRIPMIRLMPTA